MKPRVAKTVGSWAGLCEDACCDGPRAVVHPLRATEFGEEMSPGFWLKKIGGRRRSEECRRLYQRRGQTSVYSDLSAGRRQERPTSIRRMGLLAGLSWAKQQPWKSSVPKDLHH